NGNIKLAPAIGCSKPVDITLAPAGATRSSNGHSINKSLVRTFLDKITPVQLSDQLVQSGPPTKVNIITQGSNRLLIRKRPASGEDDLVATVVSKRLKPVVIKSHSKAA